MKKIVLGFDDTEASKRALERAAQLTKAFESDLLVMSVAPVLAGGSGPIDSADPPSKHLEELHHAQAYLEGQGITAHYDAAVGTPATTIVTLAAEQGADLIVVGTREPSILERVFGQSVSDTVSHKAHCDVLIVH
jgi:nucleotide-binding universal stress UspA family protein